MALSPEAKARLDYYRKSGALPDDVLPYFYQRLQYAPAGLTDEQIIDHAVQNTSRDRMSRLVGGTANVLESPEVPFQQFQRQIDEQGLAKVALGIGESIVTSPFRAVGTAKKALTGGHIEDYADAADAALMFLPGIGLGKSALSRITRGAIKPRGNVLRPASQIGEAASPFIAGDQEFIQELIASGTMEGAAQLLDYRKRQSAPSEATGGAGVVPPPALSTPTDPRRNWQGATVGDPYTRGEYNQGATVGVSYSQPRVGLPQPPLLTKSTPGCASAVSGVRGKGTVIPPTPGTPSGSIPKNATTIVLGQVINPQLQGTNLALPGSTPGVTVGDPYTRPQGGLPPASPIPLTGTQVGNLGQFGGQQSTRPTRGGQGQPTQSFGTTLYSDPFSAAIGGAVNIIQDVFDKAKTRKGAPSPPGRMRYIRHADKANPRGRRDARWGLNLGLQQSIDRVRTGKDVPFTNLANRGGRPFLRIELDPPDNLVGPNVNTELWEPSERQQPFAHHDLIKAYTDKYPASDLVAGTIFDKDGNYITENLEHWWTPEGWKADGKNLYQLAKEMGYRPKLRKTDTIPEALYYDTYQVATERPATPTYGTTLYSDPFSAAIIEGGKSVKRAYNVIQDIVASNTKGVGRPYNNLANRGGKPFIRIEVTPTEKVVRNAMDIPDEAVWFNFEDWKRDHHYNSPFEYENLAAVAGELPPGHIDDSGKSWQYWFYS